MLYTDRHLAVFDLDDTLLRGDSLLPFLLHCGRHLGRWSALGLAPLELFLYAIRARSARSSKQALLRRFLRGCGREKVQHLAEEFAARWVEQRPLEVGMERLRMHLASGHRVVLLSASPDIYVPAMARRLGVAEVVCTHVAWDGDICRGDIVGDNCKGEAKVRMLQAHLGQDYPPPESDAYGDSTSDLPVLRWARRGHLLSKGTFQVVK